MWELSLRQPVLQTALCSSHDPEMKWTCGASGFPMPDATSEWVELQWVVALSLHIVEDEALWNDSPSGQVLHWAHLLKTLRRPDGSWPARINARTGETAGQDGSPGRLFAVLNRKLNSVEFPELGL